MRIVPLAALVAAFAFAGSASAAHLSSRQLQDARVGKSKPELVAQIAYSGRVVSALRGSWRVAPRHRTCWSHVPWSRLCDQTRRRLFTHRWLYDLASQRLAHLFPPSPVELGRQMAAARGWIDYQWDALYDLWDHESGWSTTSHNPHSDACGIPQAMNDCAYGYDAGTQIAWGLAYIARRYGTPSAALNHWSSYNWY